MVDKVGVSMQPKELEQWIGTQYGVSAEYPWAVSPENLSLIHISEKRRALTRPEQELLLSYLKNTPAAQYWLSLIHISEIVQPSGLCV